MGSKKKFWTGIEDLHDEAKHVERSQNEFQSDMSVSEFIGDEKTSKYASNRRDFLKFLGFGLGAATLAACETPVIKSIPYINKPEDIMPGVPNWYASTYYDGNDYANVLVKTREGRPIHIKGNHLSPVTGGAVNARINASVMSLYNEARLTGPTEGGAAVSWRTIDEKVKAAIGAGKKVRVLTNTVISPSTRAAIAKLAEACGSEYEMGAMPMSAPAAVPTMIEGAEPALSLIHI